MNKIIHIVVTTAKPEVVNIMLDRIIQYLPSYNKSIGVLLIGKKEQSIGASFNMPLEIIGEFHNYLPIVDSRNLCQVYLQKKLKREGGIGLILDDDLRWIMEESKFTALINKLVFLRCDMAFSSLKGDSPLPKEYTRASPLLDALFAILNSGQATCEISRFMKHVHITKKVIDFEYHDFYAFDKACFSVSELNIDKIKWSLFIDSLAKGKATTRQVVTPLDILPSIGRERGGATIVLNPEALDHKNISLHCGGWISRRSDMMMARAACNAGYNLYSTPSLMKHEREETFDSHSVDKLVGDIIGVSLVESIYDDDEMSRCFKSLLDKRINKTCFILKQTSEMLFLLNDFLIVNCLSGKQMSNAVDNMISENQRAIFALNNLNKPEIVDAYFEFNKTPYYNVGVSDKYDIKNVLI